MNSSFKWFVLAYRNVLRHRQRTAVSVLISAVSLFSILIGGGFAHFTYDGLREMAIRESGHLVMANKHFFNHEESTPMQYGLSDYPRLKADLGSVDDVRYVLARIQFDGLISNGDKTIIFAGTGVDPSGEFKARGPFLTITEGSVLSRRYDVDHPKIVIGQGMAQSLNAKPGDVLTLIGTTTGGSLNALDVTVQGIMTSGVPEMDRRMIYANLKTAQILLQTDRVSTLSIYFRKRSDTDLFLKTLSQNYPNYAWRTWLQTAYYYQGVKGIYDRIFGLTGIVILLVVFFSVFNTMSMNVFERTREIGTLRAIGMYPDEITRNFVYEGLVIGLMGTCCGALLAELAAICFQLLEIQMPPPPGRSDSYLLLINIPIELLVLSIGMTLCVCMSAAWLSARKAVKKSIVKALYLK